MPFRV